MGDDKLIESTPNRGEKFRNIEYTYLVMDGYLVRTERREKESKSNVWNGLIHIHIKGHEQ